MRERGRFGVEWERLPHRVILDNSDDAKRERGRVGYRHREYVFISLKDLADDADIGGDDGNFYESRLDKRAPVALIRTRLNKCLCAPDKSTRVRAHAEEHDACLKPQRMRHALE